MCEGKATLRVINQGNAMHLTDQTLIERFHALAPNGGQAGTRTSSGSPKTSGGTSFVAGNNLYDAEYIRYFSGIETQVLPSYCGYLGTAELLRLSG